PHAPPRAWTARRSMSFRVRIAIAAAGAVALAVVLASILLFFVVRGELRAQIDETLEQRAKEIALTPLAEIPSRSGESFLGIRPGFGRPNTFVQLVRSDGTTLRQPYENFELPVPDNVLELARSSSLPGRSTFSDTEVSGTHVRVYSFAYGPGYAVQVARPLTEMDNALAQIRLYLFVIALAGIGLAAAFGLLVSRAALAPVRKLTQTAERVSETGDLSERIDVGGRDELSRLAASFNTMLAALEESTRAQRQLVADASHELRTPLTSLRTNIEVLASDHALPAEERNRLLSDVVEQLGEMTTLIAELIELAHAEQQTAEPEDVRLDLVVADTIERARRNRPGVRFAVSLDESVVHGVPATIERAIGNLLDNAAKWSPPGTEVEVEVRDGVVSVRDHGPGIADEDLPYVFDRFYRARSARGMPGSGLGLAIVRQVAESHGGDVVAERAEGGGTRMILRLGRAPVAVAAS
ncbi:MAG: HAMP domain-containing sensor histidine kinase, partial [Gaiellaceae bacterium]